MNISKRILELFSGNCGKNFLAIFWELSVAKPGLRLAEQNRVMITSRSDGQSRERKGKWDALDLVKRAAAAALQLIYVLARSSSGKQIPGNEADIDPL